MLNYINNRVKNESIIDITKKLNNINYTPREARTLGLRIRSPALYPTELVGLNTLFILYINNISLYHNF